MRTCISRRRSTLSTKNLRRALPLGGWTRQAQTAARRLRQTQMRQATPAAQ